MPETTTPAIDCEVEIGVLFGRVNASIVFGTHVGAHVTIDGNVISDIGLRPLAEGLDAIDTIRAVRQAAAVAVLKAHQEIGASYDRADALRTLSLLARELPMVAV